MTTTLVAIIQILTNEFNGSKGMWIIISMIGIIGPILYLSKGRKLIVKK
ncbi:PLDc N-terminal domain-containing protein [Aquimarina aggregata]